ncbi:hypothetical protein Hanom_Chr12g01124541 [Helianthus anomalus]
MTWGTDHRNDSSIGAGARSVTCGVDANCEVVWGNWVTKGAEDDTGGTKSG